MNRFQGFKKIGKASAETFKRWAERARVQARSSLKPKELLNRLKKFIQNFDPQASLDWASKTLQKRGTSFYGTLGTIVLSTFFVSDLTSMLVDEYIPEAPAVRQFRAGGPKIKTIADYSTIFTRNLFNSQGLIPGEEGGAVPGATTDFSGAPVKTSLPFNLIGTLIMEDERNSIGTIEDKSASIAYPVQMDDEIPGKALILQVLPKMVIFINKISNKKEYVELPLEPNEKNPRITLGHGAGGGVEKVAPTQYNVSRTEVDKALQDFNNILTQARAVPNIENGVAAGYKLFQIVPGSIYEKLGLQNGDVINGLNGTPINDPGKAFEMISELKTSSHLELQVKKDGRQQTYTYDIH
jgi:general secretion pathway protein C